ncbi:uncharacterized protein LOC134252995 [Saccostrea cucullata]|uniref:uncharacterized protein LOC134252995 n=1 Tax=Saccostrea cuccullata TaxID=36930 RepID=UPI002ED5F62F
MNHISRLSESVYVGLCREVGSPTEVRIRREVMDTTEGLNRPVYIMRGFDRMISGSRREGFRMITSDIDWMLWYPDAKVICDLSQICLRREVTDTTEVVRQPVDTMNGLNVMRSGSRREGFRLSTSDVDDMFWPSHHKVISDLSKINLCRIPQHTMILMEYDDLPPGFTRLILMSQSNNPEIISSCVVMNNITYISSTLFRDNHLLFLKTSTFPITTAVPHGPCSTYSLFQGKEADFAFCFQSHRWPTSAIPWIQRCSEQRWPDQNTVSDILRGGFHIVPIGSKPENELEWRISFSRAEQKIVYTMNHCQFLCYGLFKIFLKEVINCQPNSSILCSYFIKTILF